MIRVGFTGTQNGMGLSQTKSFYTLLKELKPDEFHHGDCIGSDEEAHKLAVIEDIYIVVHPPIYHQKRAWCDGWLSGRGRVLPRRSYLDRNTDIVNETDILIATPKTMKEELRSGTWSTVRYARKQGKKIYLILPDGTVKEEGATITLPLVKGL